MLRSHLWEMGYHCIAIYLHSVHAIDHFLDYHLYVYNSGGDVA